MGQKSGVEQAYEVGDSATSDIEGDKPADSIRRAYHKKSRLRTDRRPTFTQPSEIYGNEAHIPIARDSAAQLSEKRRTDMSVMAESIADAMVKEEEEEEEVGKLSVRRTEIFTLGALRCVGEDRILTRRA